MPLNWSAGKNIRWKSEVPGRGHASPIAWKDRIFLPTALEETEVLQMLCFGRDRGPLLWNTVLHRGGFMKKHAKNSHASATPACDGELVFFPALYDGGLWVSAVDFQGKIRWQQKIGEFVPSNGYGSSPVIYRDVVIVSSDNTGEPCLAGLDRRTGKIVWRTERPKADNFCSPALAFLAGRPLLVLCGARMIAGYDPANGKQIWFVETPTEVTACTPACGHDLVFAGGNVPVRESLCIRATGKGNVTRSHVLWRSAKNVSYVPSPLIHDGLIYMINDAGIALCLEAETGNELYRERLGGDFSSSPVLVNDRIYAANEAGEMFVLRAGRRFEVLARNSTGEAVFATPAFLNHEVLIRGARHLFSIQN